MSQYFLGTYLSRTFFYRILDLTLKHDKIQKNGSS